jgi:integrase
MAKHPGLSVRKAVSAYLVQLENKLAKSVKTSRSHAAHLFVGFGDSATVSDAQVQNYIEHRRANLAKPATINRELEILRTAWNQACPGNGVTFPKLRENNVRQGFFTKEEVHRMVSVMHGAIADAVLFAFYTGWRKSEVFGLTWPMVQEVGGGGQAIYLPDTKNGRGRVVPVYGPLVGILKRAWNRRIADNPYVFTNGGAQLKDISTVWKSACKWANLEGRLFHDLRRSAARNLIDAGVDRQVAKQITGHLTDSCFTRYQIVSQDQMRTALEKVG